MHERDQRRRADFSSCIETNSAAERLLEFRDDLEQIADKTEIGDLENRRFTVLVDRHDRAGVLDAGQVLDRAGDADRDIQCGRNDLAGLADLEIARYVAGVDGNDMPIGRASCRERV